MEKHLRIVRETGIAFDDEEYEVGVRCIAAPIFDSRGSILAAVGISGPSARITDDKKAKFSTLVKDTGEKITQSYIGERVK